MRLLGALAAALVQRSFDTPVEVADGQQVDPCPPRRHCPEARARVQAGETCVIILIPPPLNFSPPGIRVCYYIL